MKEQNICDAWENYSSGYCSHTKKDWEIFWLNTIWKQICLLNGDFSNYLLAWSLEVIIRALYLWCSIKLNYNLVCNKLKTKTSSPTDKLLLALSISKCFILDFLVYVNKMTLSSNKEFSFTDKYIRKCIRINEGIHLTKV